MRAALFQTVVLTVESLAVLLDEVPLTRDKRVSELTVIRFMFSSLFMRLSVLVVELEEELPVEDVWLAAMISLTRSGLAFQMLAFPAERSRLYMESDEVDPEEPVRAL